MNFLELFGGRALSHAYIISGPEGGGRDEFARRIAAAFVCSSPSGRPCGVCAHCGKAAENIHPDIITIDREPGKREIYVDQMRAIRADAAVMPNEAEKKVYIIKCADTMNPQAQNAMLKTLEEPPKHAAFVLVSENSGAFLPTIRSRCTEISLAPVRDGGNDASDMACAFVEAVESGDRLNLLQFLFSIERLEKNAFSDLLLETRRLASERLRTAEGSAGKRLVKLIRTLLITDGYTVFNVGTGHIVGLLTSKLI